MVSCYGHAQVFSYETSYPSVDYATRPLSDRVTRLMADIDAGEVTLEFADNGRGYLDSLLAALDIDPASQFLVFSKTALKTRFVTAANPRALYFNDDTYVGITHNSRTLEITAMDPNVGQVFFDLSQDPDAPVTLTREQNRCLRCHDSYSMTGGGVPRFLLSSVLANAEGEIVTHEISVITDTSTPLNRRWGGMYVTGTHGSQETLGNFVVDDIAKLTNMNLAANGNKTDLSAYLDTGSYISSGSDIVALLVVEHQVEVQNAITRLNFDSRAQLASTGGIPIPDLDAMVQPLLESLFMVHEAALTDAIRGSSGYSDHFQALGPTDGSGRSLRQLDLRERTFRYPFSYLIYSAAIDALPEPVLAHLYQRIRQVLAGEDAGILLAAENRDAISAILRDTKPAIFR